MKKTLLVLLVMLAVGAGGVGVGLRMNAAPAATPPVPEQPAGLASVQSYVCPMHPHIVQDHPGNCPICGMDLVLQKNAAGAAASQVYVDAVTRQKLGVTLASAEIATLTYDLPAYGTLVPDESAVSRLTPSVSGRLTRLFVNRPGQVVARGQPLYAISSQEALDLQYEYIDIQGRGVSAEKMAEERYAQNRKVLQDASSPAERMQAERDMQRSTQQVEAILRPLRRDRERIVLKLRQIGFTDDMLARLTNDKVAQADIVVHAQRTCAVRQVMAQPGMSVEPMTEILHCVDPAQSLLEIVLYADQLPWVEEGDPLAVRFSNGETLQAKLTGLHPLEDDATRTLKVRVPLTMKRPANFGEYAEVTLHTTPRRVLSVPKSAVLRSGRGDFVMRYQGNGHFMPVKVLTGIETEARVAIRSGLDAGDEVAVNGQFLLDAAASIADTAQRMRTAAPAP